MTATIGLVVHAAGAICVRACPCVIMIINSLSFFFPVADGLALGAAAGLSKTNVEFIIFIAIMLHKVGVVSYKVGK